MNRFAEWIQSRRIAESSDELAYGISLMICGALTGALVWATPGGLDFWAGFGIGVISRILWDAVILLWITRGNRKAKKK